MTHLTPKHLQRWLLGLVAGTSVFGSAIAPQPTQAAERLAITYGPLELYVPIESLETFAETGEIDSDLAFYLQFFDESTHKTMRGALTRELPLSATVLSKALYMGIGEGFLRRLGTIIQTDSGLNGGQALRSAILVAASDDSESFTLLNVLKKYPTREIRVNARFILEVANQLSLFFDYRQAATDVIVAEAQREAANDSPVDFSQRPDLREPGPYGVEVRRLRFPVSGIRPTELGLAASYDLDVDVYLPEGLDETVPVVVLTHGFGSNRDNYDYLAEHLASYGLAVAAPEHIGSNLEYREAFLRGELSDLISPIEYLSRGLDLTATLDELERLVNSDDPDWRGRIDVNRAGIMGYSFGGTTALSMAGAEINQARLTESCVREEHFTLNFSVTLQCLASYLPPVNYDLYDPRFKAALASYPITSVVFGPEGMANISIPTMLVSGSNDIIAPSIPEQIHPFLWMTGTDEKYLMAMVPGTHFSTGMDEYTQQLPEWLRGPVGYGQPYLKALNVAFFRYYLAEDEFYEPYLTASYGQYIDYDELTVNLIRELTPEMLISAYGGEPPIEMFPTTVVSASASRQESVVEEIQRTGILKAAIRSDSPPFGYLDDEGLWNGYCAEVLHSFADYLETELEMPGGIEVVQLPSSLSTRFDLVRSDRVHLECGPNTLVRNPDGIAFSQPFFVTGTQFLVNLDSVDRVNPNTTLSGVKAGVLENTTTEQFLRDRYPNAETVLFNDDYTALESVATGAIDAFASDSILILGELLRLNADLSDFALVPEQPLTCDYYGFALPDNDKTWERTVNAFISSDTALEARNEWLSGFYPIAFETLDYCTR
ncbi:Hypothetical protein CKA32_005159 [Geitlerinema sp. FC II]|nr:Hypothetical protein CKA32_005159 [Geitlerinema sp. FC II]